MFEGFTLERIDVGDAELRVRHGGPLGQHRCDLVPGHMGTGVAVQQQDRRT